MPQIATNILNIVKRPFLIVLTIFQFGINSIFATNCHKYLNISAYSALHVHKIAQLDVKTKS